MRRVYPGFLQLGGFMSMNPDRHVQSHIDFFHHLVVGDGESAAGHRRFYDEYLSVMDLSADFYLDTIRHVFQEHSLPVGTFTHRGEKVEPAAIKKTALMTIEGELDDISGLGQTKAAHDLCRNIPAARRRHLEQEGVGHYGIFNGRKWRQFIYPAWAEFVRKTV
jgi:poly(3-hydroxybutyrate) depolymerase